MGDVAQTLYRIHQHSGQHLEQIAGTHSQGSCQLPDVLETDVPLPALNTTHIIAMQSSSLR